MHIRMYHRFCSLLGSRHVPTYRVDASVSDSVTICDYNFYDKGVKTRVGPMLKFACGAGDALLL
jgi:hypothetical protein